MKRSNEGIFGGVLLSLSNKLGIDTFLVRLLFVLLIILGPSWLSSPLIIIYILSWILMPVE